MGAGGGGPGRGGDAYIHTYNDIRGEIERWGARGEVYVRARKNVG